LSQLRDHARSIWDAGVAAVRPDKLIQQFFRDLSQPFRLAVQQAERIIVVGAGKAGAAMSAALEDALADCLQRMEGVVNVPANVVAPLRRIRLHAGRPAGSNQPTAEGVVGAMQILKLVQSAGPRDVVLCLLSGGGSALLPAPVAGITLEDKQHVTQLLHACGATINEMNAVRKHLSRIKGGRLAQAFQRRALFSLIISDVIGDPLDVIASGPTAADPTTFADALAVLKKYDLLEQVPAAVRKHLENGLAGSVPETLKILPDTIHNFIIGNNARALAAAQARAEELGYRVCNLGSFIEGETQAVATTFAGLVRSIHTNGWPASPPICLLSGGETTVTLDPYHGLGGRNQEFVLAALHRLGPNHLDKVVLLSGGTDGEDGPTDAAGAIADADDWRQATQQDLEPAGFLAKHDAYHFFEATGALLQTGLTQTNVMDVRVILVG
jgi:hydroxypyruvate reductase/glycerate 2-kinase